MFAGPYANRVLDGADVAPEVELEGLDVPEFGLPAYPEDMVVAAES